MVRIVNPNGTTSPTTIINPNGTASPTITPGQNTTPTPYSDLLGRLNTAPQRPNIQPVDPTKFAGYNMYHQLAFGNGPDQAGAYDIAKGKLQQTQNIDKAVHGMNPLPSSLGEGARERAATGQSNELFAGRQNALQNGGNSILDALLGTQGRRVGALNTVGQLQLGANANRQKLALDLYEQDIKKYAATQAAKAEAGIPG